MSTTADFSDIAAEFYPGSSKPIIRHPNRPDREVHIDVPKWDANPRNYVIAGVSIEFFTVGQLGQALGQRKAVTIRKWEREGLLPKATFQAPSEDPRGRRRLYSRAQVEGIVAIAKEEGVLKSHQTPITKTQFTARVINLFQELSAR